ncbi:MAG: Protein of uncharacterized function [Gammaproteobacteria bacterium]|jgi:hypothetical protein|nr:Protein of uncharacterized function [Gammaproteobacteria bacterium]
MRVILKTIVIFTIILMPIAVFAALQMNIIPPYTVAVYDATIQKLYANQPKNKRLEYFSAAFLGEPYLNGALGEGVEGEFDQSPLYRSDAFDCMTYVSTVLALLHAHNAQEFKEMIKKINYQSGFVSYQNRNHFTSIDWNPNNEKQGFIKDITMGLHDQNNQSVAQINSTYINKKAWYAQKTLASIKLLSPITPEKQQQLLLRLQGLSREMSNQYSHLAYVPLTVLFNKQGQPNVFVFDQIPSGSIIEIVRSNWKKDGTDLDVSHLGFALRTKDGLVYREASSIENKVIDIPLAEYLRGYLNTPTVEGINIQLVL